MKVRLFQVVVRKKNLPFVFIDQLRRSVVASGEKQEAADYRISKRYHCKHPVGHAAFVANSGRLIDHVDGCAMFVSTLFSFERYANISQCLIKKLVDAS